MSNKEKNTEEFDPSYLNDSIAIKTKWTPAKKASAKTSHLNGATPHTSEVSERFYTFVKISSSCFKIKPSKFAKVAHLIFSLVFLSLSAFVFIKFQMDAFSTGKFIFDPKIFLGEFIIRGHETYFKKLGKKQLGLMSLDSNLI
jgi:hypothetical protein